jgi:hypothetical protein
LPSAVDTVKGLEVHVVKCSPFALSNNTISHRIYVMTGDVNEHLIIMFRPIKRFATRLDDSSDVADCSLLRIYARLIKPVNSVTEKSVGRSNRQTIFQVFGKFVT